MRKEHKIIEIKPYLIRELAELYGVDRRTLATWLEPFKNEIGPRIGWYYNVKQVRIIFKHLELPEILQTE